MLAGSVRQLFALSAVPLAQQIDGHRDCPILTTGFPAIIARLAALVPKPRVNLTRYHGAFNCIVFLMHCCGSIAAVEPQLLEDNLPFA